MPATFGSLPRELVQRVFTASRTPVQGPFAEDDDDFEDLPWLVLSLRDRCRGQAVCWAWRDWLSPASLPIQELSLGGYQGGELDGNDDARELKRIMAFAQWVSRTQPTARHIYVCLSGSDLEPSDPLAAAVLTALASIQPRTAVEAVELGMECPLASWFLPALRLFPRMRKLKLLCEESDPVLPLDAAHLCGLPHLADLWVEWWESAFFTQTLPALTSLELQEVGEVVLNAELPRLVLLEVSDAREARLCGERLRLPQLTCLRLSSVQRAEVDWSAMPVLEDLTLYSLASLESPNEGCFFDLTRLSFLSLWSNDARSEVAVQKLLQLAPPSLRGMSVTGDSNNVEVAALAACGRQLTRLYCHSARVVPALGPLQQLQELDVHATTAELIEHLAVLAGLPRLRKLTCSKVVAPEEVKGADWKRLVSALPKECVVVERSSIWFDL